VQEGSVTNDRKDKKVDAPRRPFGWTQFVVLLVITTVMIWTLSARQAGEPTLSLSELAQQVQAGKVERITLVGDVLWIKDLHGDQFTARKEPDVSLVQALVDLGASPAAVSQVAIDVRAPSAGWELLAILAWWLVPLLLLVGLWWFWMRGSGAGGIDRALNFGRSRARLVSPDQGGRVTFEDVAGADEAKAELQEVVEFLKQPEKFIKLGARIPKGVLLVGPPGCGKTLLAKAVAGEAGVPFFTISGSEFVEMFVGVGASRVRDLFDNAKKHTPCIVFIDEIDAVGRQRGAGLGASHDEREQTLNQILVELDGFNTDQHLIVLAATNRPDILDPALLRPGRFDRQVVIDRPDLAGREAILRVHARGKPLSPDVDLNLIARQTTGFSGADLENVINEAAILAARRNRSLIGMADLQDGVEKVMAGPERSSRRLSETERKVIAYHEAGHALVKSLLPGCDPVRKVSIVPRGTALGYTLDAPEEDQVLMPRTKFEDELAGLLAGRAAEALVFKDVTTDAADDLQQATDLARQMVMRFGMSDALGPLTYGRREELVFLGRELGEQRDYSEATARQIDREIRRLIDHAYQRAVATVTAHHNSLEHLARLLLQRETLDGSELRTALGLA
jgi:cell division protease FtsH